MTPQEISLFERAVDCQASNNWQMRSCWNCNTAHEHLKDPAAGLILCFECGHWFLDGVDLTALIESEDDNDTTGEGRALSSDSEAGGSG